MFCNNCGNQLTEIKNFCPECGAKIEVAPVPKVAGYINVQLPPQSFNNFTQSEPMGQPTAKEKTHGPVARVYFSFLWGFGWLMFGLGIFFLLAGSSGFQVRWCAYALMFCQAISIICGLLYLMKDIRKGAKLLLASGGTITALYLFAHLIS